ncbi:MAG: response regulator [Candidatus Margulisiibacteriota bacterium]
MCVAGFLLEDVKAGCATTETIIKDLTDIKAAGTRLTQLLKQLQSIIKQSKADIETEAVYPTKSTPPYLANILVVDDEPVCRGTASGVLRKKGHTVTGAANPTEALALLAQKHFDLVITDVDMGEEINGLGLLEIIKQNYPGTNVIVMSGEAATDRAEEAMTKGASAFIAKPFESAALLPIVNGCLPEK